MKTVRYLEYTTVEGKGTIITVHYQEVRSEKHLQNIYKTLKGDRMAMDLVLHKMDRLEVEPSITLLYAQKCMNFARFTPEAISYIENNKEANMALKRSEKFGVKHYTADLTWINDHCKTLEEEEDESIDTDV